MRHDWRQWFCISFRLYKIDPPKKGILSVNIPVKKHLKEQLRQIHIEKKEAKKRKSFVTSGLLVIKILVVEFTKKNKTKRTHEIPTVHIFLFYSFFTSDQPRERNLKLRSTRDSKIVVWVMNKYRKEKKGETSINDELTMTKIRLDQCSVWRFMSLVIRHT